MKLPFTFISIFLNLIGSYAQDVIIKNKKAEFKTKVLEVLTEEIKYKKLQTELSDNPSSKNRMIVSIHKPNF